MVICMCSSHVNLPAVNNAELVKPQTDNHTSDTILQKVYELIIEFSRNSLFSMIFILMVKYCNFAMSQYSRRRATAQLACAKIGACFDKYFHTRAVHLFSQAVYHKLINLRDANFQSVSWHFACNTNFRFQLKSSNSYTFFHPQRVYIKQNQQICRMYPHHICNHLVRQIGYQFLNLKSLSWA